VICLLNYGNNFGRIITMNATVKIDATGRLVLPKKIRDRLNLKNGSNLHAEVVAGRIELTPIESSGQTVLTRKKGITVIKRTGVAMDVALAISTERDSLAERGSRR